MRIQSGQVANAMVCESSVDDLPLPEKLGSGGLSPALARFRTNTLPLAGGSYQGQESRFPREGAGC